MLLMVALCQWYHTFPAWELRNVNPNDNMQIEILDENGSELIARTSLTLGQIIAKGANAVLSLLNAKGKPHGELHMKVTWTPMPVQQHMPPQQVAYPMAQSQAPPAYVSQAPVYIPSVMAQPAYYPQPVMMQQHSMAMQMQPSPVMYQNVAAYPSPAQPMYSPQAMQQSPHAMQQSPAAYNPAYAPMHAAPAAYYAGPSSGAPSMMASLSAMSPSAQFNPTASNADGIFPFSELKITRLIGDGTFGTVSAGEFRSTPVAIKQLKQAVFSQEQWAEFMSEVKFLREARHPNIVLFMGVSFNPYCIVTELLDTSLFNVLHKDKRQLTPQQQHHIALSIARGLASLHANPVPIVHRDMSVMR